METQQFLAEITNTIILLPRQLPSNVLTPENTLAPHTPTTNPINAQPTKITPTMNLPPPAPAKGPEPIIIIGGIVVVVLVIFVVGICIFAARVIKHGKKPMEYEEDGSYYTDSTSEKPEGRERDVEESEEGDEEDEEEEEESASEGDENETEVSASEVTNSNITNSNVESPPPYNTMDNNKKLVAPTSKISQDSNEYYNRDETINIYDSNVTTTKTAKPKRLKSIMKKNPKVYKEEYSDDEN
ncbi:hypothetical protein HDU92_000716 [Lobulomyces angularis]|nr:hypothetical protein HDU92_000716 [Lobulomyces angularis]